MGFEGSRGTGSAMLVGMVLMTGTLVCSLPGVAAGVFIGQVAACELEGARVTSAFAKQLEADVGTAEILFRGQETYQTGSCCRFAQAVVALVPTGPPPPGVDEIVRWTDASGVVWMTENGNTDLGTWRMDCASCDSHRVPDAFAQVRDPRAVIWRRWDELPQACAD